MLRSGLQLLPISANNKLPNTCNKPAAKAAGAVKVSSDDHDAILDEAVRRDRLEFDSDSSEEEESDEEDDEESEEEQESQSDED